MPSSWLYRLPDVRSYLTRDVCVVVHQLFFWVMSFSLLLHMSDALVENHVFPQSNINALSDLACFLVESDLGHALVNDSINSFKVFIFCPWATASRVTLVFLGGSICMLRTGMAMTALSSRSKIASGRRSKIKQSSWLLIWLGRLFLRWARTDALFVDICLTTLSSPSLSRRGWTSWKYGMRLENLFGRGVGL